MEAVIYRATVVHCIQLNAQLAADSSISARPAAQSTTGLLMVLAIVVHLL